MKPLNFTSLLQPWLIREDYLIHMATTLYQRIKDHKIESFNLSDWENVRAPYEVDSNGIAHISIFGPLMNNPDPWIKRYYAVTDYRDIRDEMQRAIEDGARGAMFRIDSPGGSVSGINETTLALDGLNTVMPTVSHVEQGAYSAGYYLASGTGLIFAGPSADVGNIGTILRFYDNSAFLEKIGFKAEAIANEGADLKSMFHPLPLTEGQRAFLQENINDYGQEFQNYVQSHRSGIDKKTFRAGWYSGQKAISMGLADFTGSGQDAYETLLGEVARRAS
jgi:ClpP class serine protease